MALFTADAYYAHGSRVSRGHGELKSLFTQRLVNGPRTARHLQTGLRFDMQDVNEASGESVCLTFGADAAPPIADATPHLVADFSDIYSRDGDTGWRISRRVITRIFVAKGNLGPVGSS